MSGVESHLSLDTPSYDVEEMIVRLVITREPVTLYGRLSCQHHM